MRKRTGQDKRIDFVFSLILVIIGLCCIYPLWFVLIASFSDPNQVALGKVLLWPKGISLDGYKELLLHPEILVGYRNSLFFLFAGAASSLLVILPAAYALSRKKLKGRRVLNFLFVQYFLLFL